MVSFENVKRLMSWCPNTTTVKYKENMSFDAPQMNAPDAGSGSTHAVNGWLNIYRNRVLLISVILTLYAIVCFMNAGIYDLDMFLSGIFGGLLLILVMGAGVWRRFDKAAAGKFISQRTRKQKTVHFLILISLIVIITFSVGFLAVKTKTNIQGIYAFMSGLALSVWIDYFEVLYWEHKNGKTLILDKTSFYAVDAETE